MALVEICVLLLTLTLSCNANVHFTTTEWEVQLAKPFVLEWMGATGAVDIELVKGTPIGLNKTTEIISNYTSDSFTWTPLYDLTSGKYVLKINDNVSSNESPTLLLSSHTSRDDPPQGTSDDGHDSKGDAGLTPGTAAGIGVGSTLGGIFVLGLVAILVYRGRKNKAKQGDKGFEEPEASRQNQR
ncbi:hypothetical protein F5B20DRAFT_579389 [Whalleya microplaca]|nr:hypothetical protein F5B20DRAFT_579389 [Whalleya microplaca]